jgi:hypothetical protein
MTMTTDCRTLAASGSHQGLWNMDSFAMEAPAANPDPGPATYLGFQTCTGDATVR